MMNKKRLYLEKKMRDKDQEIEDLQTVNQSINKKMRALA